MTNYNLSPRIMILALLRERNWKQIELADKLGISKQTLYEYFSEENRDVSYKIKIKIAEVFGVDSAVIWDFPIPKEKKNAL